MKICVYAISKNEEKFVERFCTSARQADLILIADTGSSDATRKLAQRCGAIVHQISIRPWRFDIARNTALALVPSDIDVCINLDLDEVLMPGWRDEIERLWNSETTRLRYLYQCHDGVQSYDRIHARHGYIWHRPCREFLAPDGRIAEVCAETNFHMTAHQPDFEKNRTQYLELLEYALKEQPLCQRTAYFYANELSLRQRWPDAIVAYRNFLALTAKSSGLQRSEAMRGLALAYEKSGNLDEAESWYRRAAAEAPKSRSAWCELAMLASRQGRWAECYAAATRALSITEEGRNYESVMWGHWPHELAAIAAWHLGLKDAALRQARAALAKSPTDETLKMNLQAILSENVSFSFFPDGGRAQFLDRRMHNQLGNSLAHVREKICEAGHSWADSAEPIISGLREGHTYPPSTFGIYYEIAEALLLDDIDKAAALFEEFKSENVLNGNKLQVLRFGDGQTTANRHRYERLMDTGPEQSLITTPASAELTTAFKIQFDSAYSRMKRIVPELANEFDAIIRELLVVEGDEMGFVGGSCYKLWGALFLNAKAYHDEIGLIEAIAHESAHSLLFGFTVEEPLVLNRSEEEYPSPLRDDLRPMDGIFHAIYVTARMHWTMSEFLKSGTLSAKETENVLAALRAREANFFSGYKTVSEFGKLTKTGAALLESAHTYMSKGRMNTINGG